MQGLLGRSIRRGFNTGQTGADKAAKGDRFGGTEDGAPELFIGLMVTHDLAAAGL